MIGEVIALAGAILTLLAAVGVVRFPDVLSRMHALTKASTVGFVLVAVGAAINLPTANDTTSALLAAGLQILTLPMAANLIGRSTYLAEGIPHRLDTVDELAEARARAPADGGERSDQPPPAGDG
ncbi:monovalent cation/H(+) antiporter subunit G [Iamia sp.]|uniref:monovalent cation/H(+) antiporter subunit G n=1 Tax=Iamia sp. TaxID=2722710 RepID=UPI002D0795D8|nr:monovalent cation/H(+) antiporter subunit G [Iamia sp.]HXH57716.1 monovalent cation/H(+) antiporter subunit G [Iamia sp.]